MQDAASDLRGDAVGRVLEDSLSLSSPRATHHHPPPKGVLKALNVNKLTSAGCTFKFWVADWFALLNNKMGGDLKKIRTVGLYMIEVSLRPGAARRRGGARRLQRFQRPCRCPVRRGCRGGRRRAWT